MIFSEIPHFIITAFIERSENITKIEGFLPDQQKKMLNPNFIFTNRIDSDSNEVTKWEDTEGFTWTGIEEQTWFTNSYLRGPRSGIVVQEEGRYLKLWAENEQGEYFPGQVYVTFANIEKDKFTCKLIHDLNYPSDIYEIVEDDAYRFEIYNLWENTQHLEDGTKLYIKNDSIFHEWVEIHGPDYIKEKHGIEFSVYNYLNIYKPMLYLGDIYHYPRGGANIYNIMYYNMKHYVLACIPPHQRTEKIKEFLYLVFDVLYNEVYNAQKNIWSMMDIRECNSSLLNNIGYYYGIDLQIFNYNDDIKREFLLNLSKILKSKGTYLSLYYIWNVVTGSNNRLNIYERWHDSSLTGSISATDYQEWLHTSFYDKANFVKGAGSVWYDEYFNDDDYPKLGNNEDGLILSTNYIIEADLTTEPNDIGGVLLENTIKALYSLWEEFRPINKIQDYKLLLSPTTDMFGQWNHLYDREFAEYVDTRSMVPVFGDDEDFPDTFIMYSIQQTYSFYHSLNTKNLIIDILDNSLTRVSYDKINYIKILDNNNIEIQVSEPMSYFIMLKTANIQYTDVLPVYGFWHPFKTSNLITQFWIDNKMVVPKDVQLVSYDKILVYNEDADSYTAYPADINYSVSTEASTWNINHGLNNTAIFVDVNTNENKKIYPENIKIIDSNNIQIEFKTPVLGYALIKGVGSLTGDVDSDCIVEYNNSDEFTITHTLDTDLYLIHLYDMGFNRIKPRAVERIDNSNIKITLDTVTETYTLIKSITSGDTHDYKLKDYSWFITTFSHDFSTKLMQFYNDEDEVVLTHDVELIDNQRLLINHVDVSKVSMVDSDYQHEQMNVELNPWEIMHNLDSIGVIAQVYDENWKRIEPKNVYPSTGTLQETVVEFDDVQRGRVNISKIGNPGFAFIYDRLDGEHAKLHISSTQDNLSTSEYSFDKQRIWEDEYYIYVEYNIPKNININITEMGIKDLVSVVFLTQCSDLYKPLDFEMNIFYRISKAEIE